MRLLHGSNVEIDYPDLMGIHYLDTEALLDFAEHVTQFGDKYTQYCFCTKRALKVLVKE